MAYETSAYGFMLCEHFSYNEIVQASRVAEGETGEIVSTTFFKRALPFIRYKSADIVTVGHNTHGGTFREVHEVQGRISDAFILPDGHRVRCWNLHHCDFSNIQAYQFVQADKDHIFIDVVRQDMSSPINEKTLIDELISYIGNDLIIGVRLVPQLRKTPAGKIPRLVCDIK